MNFIKNIGLILLVFSGLNCSSQSPKLADQCTDRDECCKKGKDSLIKALTTMKTKTMTCKLTTPEMQKRKTEVLASLKKKILEKQELKEGYKYRFDGTDKVIDEVIAFIKTERLCCDFFTFTLLIPDDNTIWLSITGPDGAKEFVQMEMDL